MLQTGKVAMDITGHWKILDLNQMGFDWGMGVLPYFKEPTTILCGAALGIFTSSKHQDEAFELFQALGNTASNDLFSSGLWMPLHVEDYTDPAKISQWLNVDLGSIQPRREAFWLTIPSTTLPAKRQSIG